MARLGPSGPVPDLGQAPGLAEAVFKTPQGQAGPPVSVPAGFVLFRVLVRSEGDRNAFQTQKAELADSLRTREAERLTRAYLAQERAARKVEVNEAMLSSFARGSEGGRRS